MSCDGKTAPKGSNPHSHGRSPWAGRNEFIFGCLFPWVSPTAIRLFPFGELDAETPLLQTFTRPLWSDTLSLGERAGRGVSSPTARRRRAEATPRDGFATWRAEARRYLHRPTRT